MVDLQTIVLSLMTLLLNGGADAAKELIKGAVVNNVTDISRTWQALMHEEPELYPLADRYARAPDDAAARDALKALLEQVLSANPDLLPAGGFTAISADHGSVAAREISHSTISITNTKRDDP